ncbi:MAG: hypothetical protein H7345_08875, partial [Rubritepida sp.]|nr:hypothetical protein [Rubritepida sp.]
MRCFYRCLGGGAVQILQRYCGLGGPEGAALVTVDLAAKPLASVFLLMRHVVRRTTEARRITQGEDLVGWRRRGPGRPCSWASTDRTLKAVGRFDMATAVAGGGARIHRHGFYFWFAASLLQRRERQTGMRNMTIERRGALIGAGLLGSAAIAAKLIRPATAQPAIPATQAPGFYRFKVGAWT